MSGYLPDEVNELAFASAPRRSKPMGGFVENLSKAYDAALMQSGSSEERFIKDAWDPIVQEIEDVTDKYPPGHPTTEEEHLEKVKE